MSFIDTHRGRYGVGPICAQVPIASSTYYEHKAREGEPQRTPGRVRRDEWLCGEVRRVYDGSVTATPAADPDATVELGEGDAGLLGEAGTVRLEGGAPAFVTGDLYNFSPAVEVGENGTIEGDLPASDDEDSMSCRM